MSAYDGSATTVSRCQCGAVLDMTVPGDEESLRLAIKLSDLFVANHLNGGEGHGPATVREALNARRRWAAARRSLIQTTHRTIREL